jgi:hypothetical protein
MAVEVRKLVIKATVVDDAQSASSDNSASSSHDTESIIKECVNKILELLKEKNER